MGGDSAVGTGPGRPVTPAPPAAWRQRIVERAADVALAAVPVPIRILDVGCGTGALLHEFVARVPSGESFAGVDADPEALAVARRTSDPRMTFTLGGAESLPFDNASFDLVIAVGGLRQWPQPQAVLAELARVTRDAGRVVLVARARGHRPRSVQALIDRAGLRNERREVLARRLGLPSVRAFIASP